MSSEAKPPGGGKAVVCSAEQVRAMTYDQWYAGAIHHLGRFEPYMSVLNLDPPHYKRLRARMTWAKVMACPALNLRQREARKWLTSTCPKYAAEIASLVRFPLAAAAAVVAEPPDPRYFHPDPPAKGRKPPLASCLTSGMCYNGTQRLPLGGEAARWTFGGAFVAAERRLKALEAGDSAEEGGADDGGGDPHGDELGGADPRGDGRRRLQLRGSLGEAYDPFNTQFGPVDAATLYCMVRSAAPRTIVEVGAGSSTRVLRAAMRALKGETGVSPRLVSIEPYPDDHLRKVVEETGGVLYEMGAEDVPRSVFAELQPGDILFIDSSHILKADNEIIPLYLEILPSLRAGVWVHIHDIYLPQHYRFKYYQLHWFWTEEYLLLAMLQHTNAWEVVIGNHYMFYVAKDRAAYKTGLAAAHGQHDAVTKRMVSDGAGGKRPFRYPSPASMWLRKVKD